MESFSFVIKTIVLTAVLLWVFQFRVENRSVERHFLDFVRYSPVVQPIHKIAEGSRKVSNDGWAGFKNLVGWDKSNEKPQVNTTRKASSFHWTWGESSQNSSNTTEDSRAQSEDSE